jgi:hypothetical protein
MGWEVLPHPSYSHDLSPSDYHLSGLVKDQLGGQRFKTREGIQEAARQCLRMAATEFDRRRIFKLAERWEKCVKKVTSMWKKERSVD